MVGHFFWERRAVLVMKGVDGNKTRQGLLQLRNRMKKKLSAKKKTFSLRKDLQDFLLHMKNSFLRKTNQDMSF